MRHSPASARPQAVTPPQAPRRSAPAWPRLHPLLLGPGLVMLAGLVFAAPAAVPTPQLPDPTRPPVALQMANAAQDMAQHLKPAEPAEPAPAAPLPVLQGVQIGAQGATSAMLDGQLLAIGDQLGELKVVAIDRQGVTLRGRQGDQRLSLLSGEAKQPAGSINLTRSAGFAPSGRRTGAAPGAPTHPPGPPNTEPPATDPPDRPAVRKSMRHADPPNAPNASTPRADPASPATPTATGAATAVTLADQTRP